MTFGTGATYTILYGSYVQLAASTMNYISSGKLRLYDDVDLEFGNDNDAYIQWTGSIWEFAGKPMQFTGGGINIVKYGSANDAGNSHIGRNNADGYICWPGANSFYFRTLSADGATHTNRFQFYANGNLSLTGSPIIAGGSPADGKVWTATDSSGNGQWETPLTVGTAAMVMAVIFG